MTEIATKILEALITTAQSVPSRTTENGQSWAIVDMKKAIEAAGISQSSFYGHLSKLRSSGHYTQFSPGVGEVLTAGEPTKVPMRTRVPKSKSSPTPETNPVSAQPTLSQLLDD